MSLELNINQKPLVMGILNVTPDSFSDGGKYTQIDKALDHALGMIEDGADIIDIGGESSRQGSKEVSSQEEIDRVIPVIEKIRNDSNIPISIDTTKASVMSEAIKLNIQIINDISSLKDEGAFSVLKNNNVYICLMHMKGTPKNMQDNPIYENVVEEVKNFLEEKISLCVKRGILKERLIIDPGFGFGKTLDHNYLLLKNLQRIKNLHKNLLVGISRKSMIGNLLNKSPDQRLHGSLAATLLSIYNGANIIRTHDVRETKLLLNITKEIADYNL